MNLVVVAAFIAVCGAAKLDRTYLPPSSANTAGGSPGSLQTPLTRTSEQGLETPNLPTGSYTNNFEGVVVDAASPGTRASPGTHQSGLGEPRPSYGSTDSKVGDAAFRGSAGFRNTPFGASQFDNHAGFASNQGGGQFPTNQAQGFENKSERPQAAKDRNSNILAFSNDVSSDNYSYGFETDNGIAVGENGVAVNGVQAEGGYSYQGDDGKVYKVTYTADEGGYRPQGAHLPTPPPIPEDILKSLEKNAKEEAAGIVDDGSYDAQKYNNDGDYTHHNGGNIQYNRGQLSQFEKRPESDATTGTLIDRVSQGFGKPGSGFEAYTQNHATFNAQKGEEGRPGQFGHINTHSSQSNVNDLQANGKPESGQFSHHSASQNSHSTINGQASHNVDSNSQSSHSSQQSVQHNAPSGLNAIGQNAGNQFSSQGSQHSGFGSQSQFGSQFASQQASALPQQENQLLSSASRAQSQRQEINSQFGSKPTNKVLGQNAGSSTFNSQSAQSQFGSQTFKPQGSEAFDGASLQQQRPSTNNNGNQAQSPISESGLNKPLPSNFNGQPTPTANPSQFSNIASNSVNKLNLQRPIPARFVNKNEYYPSPNSNGQSQLNNPKLGFDSNNSNKGDSSFLTNLGQNTVHNEQIPNFTALNVQKPDFTSASAVASFGQAQPALPLNHLNEQQESQLPSQTSAQFSSSSQNTGSFSSQFSPNLVTKPTSIPNTELTTPLEPNEAPVLSQRPQISSQTKPSFGTFGSSQQPAINNQAHTQFGFKGDSATGLQSSSQTRFPGSQIPTQLPISSEGKQPQKFNPQFSQNSFAQNQQAFNQGADNSYYYNQPPKPFNSPAVQPESSRFPSSPSYQSNGVASPHNTQLFNQQSSIQEFNKFPVAPTSATQFSQSQEASSNYFNGITQADISPFPSVPSTPANEFGTSQNGNFGSNIMKHQSTFSNQGQSSGSQFNKQTSQATVQHSFPSRPVSQFIQNPIQSQTQAQFGQNEKAPGLSDGSPQQQTTMTQQYEGTIYEYNKPMEILPTPSQSDSSPSQTIQEGTLSGSKPSFGQFQGNQIPTAQNENPQFGSQAQIFGQNSFSSQTQQTGLSPDSKFDSQPNKPFGSAQFGQQSQSSQGIQGSTPQQATQSQFSAQSGKPLDSTSQFGQTAPLFPNSGSLTSLQQNNQKPQSSTFHKTESHSGSKPQLGSQTQVQITQQSIGSSQNSQSMRGPQPQYSQIKPVSNAVLSQGSGYFYPQNPKPQFGNQNQQNQFVQSFTAGSNQFNQNSQSESSQTAAPFNQQSQFGSPLKPQFTSQFNQNTQTSQKTDTIPSQAFGRPNQGQPFASSQAIASGQATASAHASSSPQQQYQPQNKPLSNSGQNQPDIQNQNVQGILKDNQNLGTGSVQGPNESSSKPFVGQPKPIDRPFGGNTQVPSKPSFSSPCCQGSKSPAQSTDKAGQGFSSQGSQNFNAQNFAGKGEQFDGPQQAPHFDEQTGYHY